MYLIKKTAFVFLATAIISLFSCDDRSEVEALKTETMRIHDEAMKEMGPLNARARAIKKEIAELDSLSPRRDSLRQMIVKIEAAEEEMMDWMKQYKEPANDMPKAAALKYLQEQKAAIEKNHAHLKEALQL